MLLGRIEEVGRLDALALSAQAGDGDRLVLVGEPGMGRSALLDTARRRALRRGLGVVHLRVARGQAGLRFSLLEDLGRRLGLNVGGADPPAEWNSGALHMLEAAVVTGPVVLMVDDADLADAESLAILRTALDRLGPAPLAVALAMRPRPDLVDHFADWQHLALAPLRQEAATALLRATLGPGRTSPVLDAISRAMHANPLALTRVGESLTEDQIAGRAPLADPMPVPNALAASWSVLLDGLSPRARSALVDLAVAGTRVDVLTSMTLPGTDPHIGLDELIAAGLVALDPAGEPVLGSPTLRDVVLTRSPAGQVRQAHSRAARGCAALGRPPAEVVDHLRRSVIAGDPATARAIAEQAVRAESDEHLESAARAWQDAAPMTPDPVERVQFTLAAVRLAHRAGDVVDEEVLQYLGSGALTPDDQAHVAALLAEHDMDSQPRVALARLWAVIDRAVATAPASALLPLFDAATLAWTLGEVDAGLGASRTFADLTAAGWRDPDGLLPPWADVALLAAGLFQSGEVARAAPLRRVAMQAARAIDPWDIDINQLVWITSLDDILLDTSPDAEERLQAEVQRAVGEARSDPCRQGILAWRARARGEWQHARMLIGWGRPLAEARGATQPWLGMTALSVELAALCGDEELLRDEARQLREVASRCGDRRRLATLDRALGLHALVSGRLEEATARLAAAADVPFLGRGLRDGVLPARVDLIEALVRGGQLAEAARRHGELHHLLVDMQDPLASALDERAAALVTGAQASEAHLRRALEHHECAGEPFEQGRTELLLGEHLRRVRRRSEARGHLQRAIRAFDDLGARPWAERAGRELRAIGGRNVASEAPQDGNISTLTAQERAVTQAVASGMTNREVADSLFLSTRTVEYHLANAYRKLGVHGRGALARALGTEQVQPPNPPG